MYFLTVIEDITWPLGDTKFLSVECCSLRSKRFRWGWIFGFDRARNKTKAIKWGISFLPSPPPSRSFTSAICRAVYDSVPRSLLLNRTQTLSTQAANVEKYFTRSLRSLVKYFSRLEEKFRIPSGHVMFYLLYKHQWNTKPLHFNNFLAWKARFIM